MRRGLSWLLTVPLVVAGSELAHAIGYWSAVPNAQARAQVLAATGHGYLDHAPLALALGAVTVVLAVVLHATGAAAARVRAWPFALLPLLTFTLQEHLERIVHGISASGVVLEPTFVRGIALQIPFGLIAYFIARALLHVAERIVAALRSVAPKLRPLPVLFQRFDPPFFRPVLLAAGCGVRGPPTLL